MGYYYILNLSLHHIGKQKNGGGGLHLWKIATIGRYKVPILDIQKKYVEQLHKHNTTLRYIHNYEK